MGRLLRLFALKRVFDASRGRRGGRSRRGGGYYRPRRRSRSNVRVGGCCLPIPLGLFTLALAGPALVVRRARR